MPGSCLAELTLSHFRSHRRAVLSLDPRPVAVHGANGAGKTNILEAVSLLSPGRGLRRAAAEDMAQHPGQSGWKVAAVLQTPGGLREVETVWQPGGARGVTIDGKAATRVALGRLLRMVWLVPSMDRLWIEGADGRRRFLDRIAMSFEPDHAETSLAYDKAMRERNRLLKDQVRDAHWYAALEARMAEAGIAIQANRRAALARIGAAQDGAETAFPAATLTLGGAEDSQTPPDSAAFAAALAESRPRDMAAGRTLVGPHRAELDAVYAAKGVPARHCSTGEQKALLISVILANARALTEDLGTPPILLLDEVAAHLDAERRAALYAEICALGAQAWMTGTGAELFAELGTRAQYLHVAEEAGLSTIIPEKAP